MQKTKLDGVVNSSPRVFLCKVLHPFDFLNIILHHDIQKSKACDKYFGIWLIFASGGTNDKMVVGLIHGF